MKKERTVLLHRSLTFMLFYITITTWLGWNIWTWLSAWFGSSTWLFVLFLVVHLYFNLSFFLFRMVNGKASLKLSAFLHWSSVIWMSVFIAGFLIVGTGNLIILILNFAGVSFTTWTIRLVGSVLFLLCLLLIGYGYYNAKRSVVRRYTLHMNKQIPNVDKLRIVAFSDVHLGRIVGVADIRRLVRLVNKEQPDVVLVLGDLLDEDIIPFEERGMLEELSEMQARDGVFLIPGNHEYYAGHLAQFEDAMTRIGWHMLRDSAICVNDSYTLVGRNDPSGEKWTKGTRKPLSELLENVNRTLPMILMDHQPFFLTEGVKEEFDLQLSGHTHRGQIWPGRLITHRVYELDYGYLKRRFTHSIVTSGFGTWGPPLRIGTQSEIIVIELHGN
ncbi:MAG: metallophosphoesterase [Bacilli bacterium]